MTVTQTRPTATQRGTSWSWPLALACLFALAAPARAEPVSRARAVGLAMAQNPQVAAARAAEAQARARFGQTQAASYPTVTMTLAVGPSLKAQLVEGSAAQSTENTYGDVGFDDFSVGLGGQLEILQPLYTFGKISHRAAAAKHEVRAREAQTRMTRTGVALEVAQLYEVMLLARDIERFFAETDHWLARAAEDTEAEIEAGTGPTELDLLRLQTALGAIRLGHSQAATSRRQAQAGLGAYLGLKAGVELEPQEVALELLPAPSRDVVRLVETALRRRPELSALSEGSAAYRALAEAEQAGHLPDFFLLGFVFGGYTPGRDVADSRYIQDPLNGFYPGVLAGARFQFTGDMASRRADENVAMARELEQTRRWARSGLPAEVTKAFEDLKRAQQDEQEAGESVKIAKRWLVKASADYSIGLGDSRSVTDAAQAYVQLRVAHFDSKYRHNVALAELARATGTLESAQNPFYPSR